MFYAYTDKIHRIGDAFVFSFLNAETGHVVYTSRPFDTFGKCQEAKTAMIKEVNALIRNVFYTLD